MPLLLADYSHIDIDYAITPLMPLLITPLLILTLLIIAIIIDYYCHYYADIATIITPFHYYYFR
jgi:hypothetical protein